MASFDTDALISESTKGIPNEDKRKAVAKMLTVALRNPGRPDRPELWRSQRPKVMFDPGDPRPEPFNWGQRKWVTVDAYDGELAGFLGNLACGPDVPEAQTRGLAWRALLTANPEVGEEDRSLLMLVTKLPEALGREPDRMWHKPIATRLTGPDCPPAKGLPDDMRRQLEQLATRGEAPETSPPGAAE